MFKFNLIRSSRDIFAHLILIAFPVLLIAFFNFIFKGTAFVSEINGSPIPYLTVLTVGFALTFQIYGASLSFETMGSDFFSPMRDRLFASPCNPRSLILSILTTSVLVSFLQTIVVLLFAKFVLGASVPSLPLVLMVMLLSVVFHQLLGSVIMLASGSVKTANIIISTYGSIAPMLAGLYFPLPDTPVILVVEKYLTPMALGKTAILGIFENNIGQALAGTLPLLALTIGLFFLIRPLIGKVTS
ncbi:MAG TPA: hypothetical protein DEZ27_03805 [Sphaerochaeta sp.]|nr:hypothetical protein [Sphaerochaeta sp.]